MVGFAKKKRKTKKNEDLKKQLDKKCRELLQETKSSITTSQRPSKIKIDMKKQGKFF